MFIDHVTPIVNMRRYLVDQGKMDQMLQDALANLGRYGNSFGQSERMRANGLGSPARCEEMPAARRWNISGSSAIMHPTAPP